MKLKNTLEKNWEKIRPRFLGEILYRVARSIGLTLKIEAIDYEKINQLQGGKIYLGWHGRTFLAANFLKGKGIWSIISHSLDGEMQTYIFQRFGFRVIRGSSSKGGIKAALEAIKVLKNNETLAFTPDGPRGPSGTVHDGVLFMAQKSGAWIVPAGVSAKKRWFAPSWDRYMIPLPFSKSAILFGEPFKIPVDATDEDLLYYKKEIQKRMNELEIKAESMMGYGPQNVCT